MKLDPCIPTSLQARRSVRFRMSALVCLLVLFALPLNRLEAQSSTDGPSPSYPELKLAGFLQQHFVLDQTSGSPARFSIYRARLGVTGSITDRVRVNLIGGYVEPPDRTPRLVNAFIDFDIHPLLQVRTGQFLLPFGLEGPEVIVFNPAIERTTAIRRLNTFAMFRDIGVQVSGRHSGFSYAVAVVNGSGANQPEQFNPKDVLGRLGWSPVDNLAIGVSGHIGQYRPIPSSDAHESRLRAGVDVSYQGDPLFFRGEYMVREDGLPGGRSRNMKGAYLLGGYRFSETVETVARYEFFDPGTSSDDDSVTGFLMGVNLYVIGNTRLSVNYEIRDDRLNPDLDNVLTLQMQVAL
ncbi:MAG: porin [Balneolaceae bacterium]